MNRSADTLSGSWGGANAVIGLGANLDDRALMLQRGLAGLREEGIEVLRRSRIYESRPFGVTDQPPFLNAAAAVLTMLTPAEVLTALLRIEERLGRRREDRWGPRVIDLDLLLYRDVSMETPQLTLPHAGILERDFVLMPLVDLGIPAEEKHGPAGWRGLLEKIPEDKRMIVAVQTWESTA